MSFDPTAIRLTWTAPSNGSGGAVSSYEIRCSASAINASNWASATVCTGYPNPFTPKAPGQTETFTATNLSRLTKYYFAMKSSDGSQWSNISNCVNASTRQPQQDVGDWWLYQDYYNSEEGSAVNTNYEFRYISAVNQTAYVNYSVVTSANRRAGFQPANSYYYSNTAVLNWITNQSGSSCTNPYRARLVGTGVTGFMVPSSALNTYHDNRIYINATDPLMWIDTDGIPRAYSTTLGMGDGHIPTAGHYSYNNSAIPAAQAYAPNGSEGYPFTVGQNWSQWMWMTSFDTYLGSSNIDQERGYRWNVTGSAAAYNVDAACEAPAATGSFYVMNVSYTMDYWKTYSGGGATGQNNSLNASASAKFWYSEDVHNFVRELDRLAYYGREDTGIVKYEVQDFGKSLNVTNTSHSAWPTINMTVTNTNDYPTSFNVLLVVMNASAHPDCPKSATNQPYFFSYGKTVYPDMANVSQMNQAIQNTGTLNPGQNITLTWSHVWQVPATNGPITPELQIWCSGQNYTWTP
jgi:hypothetical protein